MGSFFIYVICWFGLAVLAIINGALREKLYGPFMKELSSHQLSTFIGIIIFICYIWIITGVWKISSSFEAVSIGIIWLFMTVLFEFVFGHFVMKCSWEKLFNDYNIKKGRVWILVLVWITAAPYVFYLIRSWI